MQPIESSPGLVDKHSDYPIGMQPTGPSPSLVERIAAPSPYRTMAAWLFAIYQLSAGLMAQGSLVEGMSPQQLERNMSRRPAVVDANYVLISALDWGTYIGRRIGYELDALGINMARPLNCYLRSGEYCSPFK